MNMTTKPNHCYAHSGIMKKTAITFVAFLFGTILGFVIVETTFRWLAVEFGGSLVSMSPAESFTVHSRFAFGCGILFAAAVIFSKSRRRFFLYLAVGAVVSMGAAAIYRASYVTAAAVLPAGWPRPEMSLHDLPALRVPLYGAFAIVCLVLALHLLANKPQAPLTPNESNA